MRGEEVFAFVVLRSGAAPTVETASALQAHCLEALAYYKAPGYVAFRADLPQTASQKLARGEIKALAGRRSRRRRSPQAAGRGASLRAAGRAFDLRAPQKTTRLMF